MHVAYFAGIFEAFFESGDGVFLAFCTTQIYDDTGVLDGMISSTFLPRLVKNKNVSHSWGVGLTPFGTTLPVLDNFIVLL